MKIHRYNHTQNMTKMVFTALFPIHKIQKSKAKL